MIRDEPNVRLPAQLGSANECRNEADVRACFVAKALARRIDGDHPGLGTIDVVRKWNEAAVALWYS
jgi:hypothetical protein